MSDEIGSARPVRVPGRIGNRSGKSEREAFDVKSVTILFCCIMGLGFGAVMGNVAFAAVGARDTFSTRVGEVEVDMLSEAQREGNLDILIGATSDDIAKYVPTGKFPNAVNVFLVRTPKQTVLIDTGFGTKVADNMASFGVKPEDVGVVLITHSHGDHIGGLLKDGKPAFPNAKVYIAKPEFDWSAAAREKLAPYKQVEQFVPGKLESGAELIPGVRPIAAYGHTPGHTLFMIESKGEKLLIWADLTHAMAIQMPLPGVSVTYDSDPVEAAASRKAVLKYVSDNKIPIGGMHVAYPGLGRVSADPKNPGGYTFDPLKR